MLRPTRDSVRLLRFSTTGLSPPLVQFSAASSNLYSPRYCPTTPKSGLLGLGCSPFAQLVIQRYIHGVEHGHIHVHHHGEKMALSSVIIGLSLHAAMEGIPLGFNYHSNSTEPALYLAIATHKFPEAILVASLLIATGNRTKIIPTIVFFSAITPVTAILAHNLGIYFLFVSTIISVIIPIVAGAFLHIATTIFFESGTKHHMLTNKKILAILLGVGLGLLTTLIHD